MKLLAMLGAVSLAVGGLAATPAAAQYHHGYHGGGYHHGYHHRGYYRGGYGYRHHGYYRHGYRHHCRFGRCHRY